jgi:hypothetical protein
MIPGISHWDSIERVIQFTNKSMLGGLKAGMLGGSDAGKLLLA